MGPYAGLCVRQQQEKCERGRREAAALAGRGSFADSS